MHAGRQKDPNAFLRYLRPKRPGGGASQNAVFCKRKSRISVRNDIYVQIRRVGDQLFGQGRLAEYMIPGGGAASDDDF